jgi:hypothetical protein
MARCGGCIKSDGDDAPATAHSTMGAAAVCGPGPAEGHRRRGFAMCRCTLFGGVVLGWALFDSDIPLVGLVLLLVLLLVLALIIVLIIVLIPDASGDLAESFFANLLLQHRHELSEHRELAAFGGVSFCRLGTHRSRASRGYGGLCGSRGTRAGQTRNRLSRLLLCHVRPHGSYSSGRKALLRQLLPCLIRQRRRGHVLGIIVFVGRGPGRRPTGLVAVPRFIVSVHRYLCWSAVGCVSRFFVMGDRRGFASCWGRGTPSRRNTTRFLLRVVWKGADDAEPRLPWKTSRRGSRRVSRLDSEPRLAP